MIKINGIEYRNDAVKGDAIERALAEFFASSYEVKYRFERCRNAAGASDILVYTRPGDKRYHETFEVKTSAASLYGDNSGELFAGSKHFIYIPLLPDELFEDIDGERVRLVPGALECLEGFYFEDKRTFIRELRKRPELIRTEKLTTAHYRNEHSGNDTVTAIKTFWSNSKKAVMSKKVLNGLLDLCYENAEPLEDYLERALEDIAK